MATVTVTTTQFTCTFCFETLDSDVSFLAHRLANKHTTWCLDCGSNQGSGHAMRQHQIQHHGALPCGGCRLVFATLATLRQHTQQGHHSLYACSRCQVAFDTLLGLEEHLNSARHHSGTAPGQPQVAASIPAPAPVPHQTPAQAATTSSFRCSICNVQFQTEKSLWKHFKKSVQHHWCPLCKQDFPTSQRLLEHVCEGKVKCKCFFCGKEFEFVSALAHHVESGTHDFIDRHHITSAVYSMKVLPDITTRGIEGTPEELPRLERVRLDESSWNGTAFACPVCPNTFDKLKKLNAHVNSPVHDADQFKCPNAKCKRKFVVISAFIQHIESGCCGLANGKEIGERFAHLSGQFSRSLAS